MIKRLILFILLLIPCFSTFGQDAVDIVPVDGTSEEVVVGFNEEVRKIAQRLRSLEANSISLTSQVSGVLPVGNGGTGVNWSTVPQGSISYFSAQGVMDTVGIGTTGYYLTSNGTIPGWTAPPAEGLVFVSATPFSGDTSKTITGLTTGTPYLLIFDVLSATANEELYIYPNGTLSTAEGTAGYFEVATDKIVLSNSGTGFGSGTYGNFAIRFRTKQGDTTKTAFLIDGFNDKDDVRIVAYVIEDSNTALSSITIEGQGTMTLTGTAYLYKYITS